jgi:DNA-binding NarL/FixJ family response regulator
MKKIVLVDDHPVVRKGVKTLIEEESRYRVVGEAGTGAEAVNMILGLKPHAALIDLTLPDRSGFDVVAEVKKRSPETRVIILSMHADESHVNEAVRVGADGYVVKDAMEHEIANALAAVLSGDRYFSAMLRTRKSAGPAECDGIQALTAREREVLCLLAEGLQNKEVAVKLGVSLRTAETHRARIMKKLKTSSIARLVKLAIRNNMVRVS